jgi:N-dimethylarginine dimethylaminohydrolase
VVENNIVVAQGISNELRKEFENLKFNIHEVDSIEYRKGGGSVKCMSFEF